MTATTPHNFIAVGPCYIDTILSVPSFPHEDTKLRATTRSQRRGGNTLNTLEVLQQFAYYAEVKKGDRPTTSNGIDAPADACTRRPPNKTRLYSISVMPDMNSADTTLIRQSFDDDPNIQKWVDLRHSHHRRYQFDASASYIISSSQTGSRTIVNYNELAALEIHEYVNAVTDIDRYHGLGIDRSAGVHFHFEARDLDMIVHCSNTARQIHHNVTISVEVERAGTRGLEFLGSYIDFAFFSKSWAMNAGYQDAASCVQGEIATCGTDRRVRAVFCTWGSDDDAGCLIAEASPLLVVSRAIWVPPKMNGTIDSRSLIMDTTGAGDTWTAAMLYALLYMRNDSINGRLGQMLDFANEAAGRKIRRWGFSGIGKEMEHYL